VEAAACFPRLDFDEAGAAPVGPDPLATAKRILKPGRPKRDFNRLLRSSDLGARVMAQQLRSCPLHPANRRSTAPLRKDAMCQNRTHASQQKTPVFSTPLDHVAG
jgi:hypothetical protein